MGGVEQPQVVDPGGRGRLAAGLLGAGLGVGVPADLERDGLAEGPPVVADLDVFQVEGVEDQLGLAAGQQLADLVGVAVQRHGGGLGDGAVLAPQERLAQLGRGRQRQRDRDAFLPAAQRGCPGLGVRPDVVDGLCPGGEQPVQLREAGDRRGRPGGDLDQELVADGAEEPSESSPSFGPAGLAVD